MSRKEDEEGRGEQKGVLLKGKDPYQRSGSHEDNKNNGVGVVTIVALLKSGFCSPSLHSPYFQSVCLRNLGRALTSDIMQKISLPLLNFEKIIKMLAQFALSHLWFLMFGWFCSDRQPCFQLGFLQKKKKKKFLMFISCRFH